MNSLIIFLENSYYTIIDSLDFNKYDIYLIEIGNYNTYLENDNRFRYFSFDKFLGKSINNIINKIDCEYLFFHNGNFKIPSNIFKNDYECDVFLCNNGIPNIQIINNLFYFSFVIKTNLFKELNGFNEYLESLEYLSYEFLYRVNRLGYFIDRGKNNIIKLNKENTKSKYLSDIDKMKKIKSLSLNKIIDIYKLPKRITMLTLGYSGRLGNQLFQYAMLYVISKNTNRNITLIKNKNKDDEYKQNHLKHFDIKFKYLNEKIDFVNFNEDNFEYDELFIDKIYQNQNTVININGYFQSYKYFEKYKNQLRNIFVLKKDKNNYVKNLFNEIKKNTNLETVSIHVRRGDYAKYPEYHNILDIDYYKSAIEYVPNKFYIICSDDIEWCKQNFNFINNIYYSNEEYYMDLILMSLCDNNIIANSSFSWWSAYLNTNPNKIVVCPKKWFNFNGPKFNINDIVPEQWIKI